MIYIYCVNLKLLVKQQQSVFFLAALVFSSTGMFVCIDVLKRIR